VGAVKKGSMNIEDYGYCLEKIILYVTGLGLGTCWLGGTFTRRSVINALGLEEDEVIPAITPVGYKNDRGLVDKVIRCGAGNRNRKPWSELFFMGDFDTPLSPNDAGLYTQALEMVRIAPTGSNGQPWRLVLDGNSVHFHHDDSYYSITKRLDIGIAFSHFDLAMKEKGIEGKWMIDSSLNESGYVSTWKRKGQD
jgi:hypothetical protein